MEQRNHGDEEGSGSERERESESGNQESVRIHVGGLGPSVLSSDLTRTFSSVAPVSSVDIVRTKGRNFAYITFHSPSPQAIKRIFNLFNGCIWKGGRLKLEKAKESYIDKLHREWKERSVLHAKEETEASQASAMNLSKSLPQLNQSDDLEIYFPGLRKVKRIPVKGVGRHKRSFERVNALPCSLLEYCINDGDRKSDSPIQGMDTKSTEIKLDGGDKINHFKENLQRKRSKVYEMETQVIGMDGKDKSPSRKRMKLSGGEPTNVIFEEQPKDQLELKRRETGECAKRERFMPEKRVNIDLQARKRIKDVKGEEESHDTNLAQRENNGPKFSGSASWFQKGSWKSLVGQTGRISFNVLGQSFSL